MSKPTFDVELLHRRMVCDAAGKAVGRVQEIRAEKRESELVVTEYHLARMTLLYRFGVSLLSAVGIELGGHLRVPWDRLDLSDPERPTLLGTSEDLEKG
jgi:hypothetical protein